MHLLYVDMSGNAGKRDERFLIMAGVAVYETAVYHVIGEIEDIMRRHLPERELDDFELHANAIRSGRKKWRSISRTVRESLMHDVLGVLMGKSRYNLKAFGMAIEKVAASPDDPVEHAFEQMSDRFDKFLRRIYLKKGYAQRGLIIVDKSRYEDTLQTLARDYRTDGTRWGNLRNLAEVPLFVDSRASRLIQLADLVSYALWRRYEHGDATWIAPIIRTSDNDGGVYHGLYHKRLPQTVCDCPACACRATE